MSLPESLQKRRRLATGTVILSFATNAFAIAFCALRDPTHQIHELYPEATGFRSLVSRVDRHVKDDVGAQLPFTLHNRELGQHTLYVVLHEEESLGLVHVRSESSRWGLVEIVWALELDLRIRDFRFQRCREPACETLASGAFKAVIQGKSAAELTSLLDDDRVDHAQLPVSAEEQPLAEAVIRSALKTILVTRLVWAAEVAEIE